MIMQALIIDDEPLAHEIILEYLADVDFIEVVDRCYSATEALNVLHRRSVDLLFLDINMPKLKGLDFLKILAQKPITIITSAHKEYALDGYDLDVCDYLLKPFRFDRFLKAIDKARERHQATRPLAEPPPAAGTAKDDEVGTLFLKVDKKLIQTPLAEIVFLEAYGNYVKVWVGKQYLLTPRTLSSFEEQLDGALFMRIHKSYMVHKKHIQFLEAGMVGMSNGKQLPLGKNFKHLAKELENPKTG